MWDWEWGTRSLEFGFDHGGRKARKGEPRFPPFRRRDPSARATQPDFRAGLGEWARKSGCAVLGMTVVRLVESVNGTIGGSSYAEGAQQAAPYGRNAASAVGFQQSQFG